MIPVYICEDNIVFQEKIKEIVADGIMIHGYDMEIVCVSDSTETILKNIKKQKRGIYFLDVDLKGSEMNGFELGKEIRNIDSRGFIIYITDHANLSFETFKLRLEAMDYIVKDDFSEIRRRVYECLKSINERVVLEHKENKQYFSVKVMNEIYHVDFSEIYFFETSNQKHRVILHSESKKLEFLGNLNETEEKLPAEFIRVHRSYIVNSTKIKQIDFSNNIISFDNELSCLLSRNMKKEMKKIMQKR